MQMTVSCHIELELTFKATDTTMQPRYDMGSLVVAINTRQVKRGDHAVIVFADGSYQIRHIAAIGQNHVSARRYHPDETTHIENSAIKAIFPIRYSIEK
jgi:hypothetical protein|tara:strand:- start:8421 stop:8717 length:297 start_codon:yes stop_codon:yes gene_type:complete